MVFHFLVDELYRWSLTIRAVVAGDTLTVKETFCLIRLLMRFGIPVTVVATGAEVFAFWSDDVCFEPELSVSESEAFCFESELSVSESEAFCFELELSVLESEVVCFELESEVVCLSLLSPDVVFELLAEVFCATDCAGLV